MSPNGRSPALAQPGFPAGLRFFMPALALLLAGAAGAHDLWIEPSRFAPDAGQRVALGLWSGDGFAGSPVPRRAARTARFTVLTEVGEVEVRGVEGVHPAGFFVPTGSGAHWAVYETTPRRLELAAARFEHYLSEEGLEAVVEERRRRDESSAAGRESYSRCAKSLIEVGGPAARPAVAAVGCPLELVLETAPGAVAASGRLSARLLFRGRPLAGARVAALRRGAPERILAGRTDDAGRVELAGAEPGLWLLKSVHMERAPAGPEEVDWRSWWASLTVTIPAPGAPREP